jgi:Ser/Thr protein kinase RdoA (MazF antagonist)
MRWDVATTLGDTPHWGPWHASVFDPAERRQLQMLADVVRARLEAFGTGPERFGLCHADLRMANIIHDEETGAITLIDFDDAGLSWFLYDLGPTFTLCEERATPDVLADWVEGYRSVAPLSEEDARELPTFLMLRRLLVSAFAGHRSDIDLAAEMHASGYATQSCVLAESYLSEFG